ncbi:hypothetical protein CEE37_15040 [candidate division LCP-89 bacterium B3_LCP]|uniref:Uncharacterized protein n=1 Tax=candidate division LCP-89 bacterium B3_LCP TaxID=2012998 RepID=A0A532UNV3_UNCL8|nr:MAG: hypothetical protein CEE37_15040 [candidate division LCP-89 bacterium B3_LCP]
MSHSAKKAEVKRMLESFNAKPSSSTKTKLSENDKLLDKVAKEEFERDQRIKQVSWNKLNNKMVGC